jgi:hypothetical protein
MPSIHHTRVCNTCNGSLSDTSLAIAQCTSKVPPVEVPQIFHSRNCTPQQLQQLHGYLDYLLEVNKTMNLTGK